MLNISPFSKSLFFVAGFEDVEDVEGFIGFAFFKIFKQRPTFEDFEDFNNCEYFDADEIFKIF